MWLALALAAALFQVLRNTAMKRLGHALDEYINVWGRFTFLLPFALATAFLTSWPALQPGFFAWCLAFGVCQTLSTLALSKALKLAEISLVTALWKVSLLILLGMAWVTIGERPSAIGVAGVLLSAGGVYLLNVTRAHISPWEPLRVLVTDRGQRYTLVAALFYAQRLPRRDVDRKSTRLNSSHLVISYAVFCLKKKKKPYNERHATHNATT